MFWIIHSCHQWQIERGICHKSYACRAAYQENCLVGSSLRFRSVLLPRLEPSACSHTSTGYSPVRYMSFSTHVSWQCEGEKSLFLIFSFFFLPVAVFCHHSSLRADIFAFFIKNVYSFWYSFKTLSAVKLYCIVWTHEWSPEHFSQQTVDSGLF